ncbi:tripartite tricarboxylate transporter TctB family protein [Natrinema amylolyticum]|uniref:tripartite tricarboxylate transporter TctB family protein n=1 Tax=Natrinema amylolyticum TaxID=2878679 RepID=UPI001CF9A5EA|nr:tripartite tricarboxylate transporter TctB family protein [Natrinema amylolyticum]
MYYEDRRLMVIKKVTRNIREIDADSVKSNPLSILFILFSLIVIYSANQFPDRGELGAGFFPIILSAAIIVFSIIDIITDDDTELEMSTYDLLPPAIIIGLLVGYVLLMSVAGFLLATMAILPVVLYYSGVRSKLKIGFISVVFPIVLFYVFSRIFMVRLPEGTIPVSRLLPHLPLGVI